jgi:26S proteasome regulatory subunit N2
MANEHLREQEAVELLEPMTKDPIDFVRQGALISLSMILVEQTEAQNPKVKMARELFEKTVSDKHEDSLAKFGAAISQGIIDAGGRNVTISMQTKAGTPKMWAWRYSHNFGTGSLWLIV